MTTNPSAITRILQNRGHQVSKPLQSSIRGLREYSAGFRSEAQGDDTVGLYYRVSSLIRSNRMGDTAREKLLEAQGILEDRGYRVEQRHWAGHQPFLTVTKKS